MRRLFAHSARWTLVTLVVMVMAAGATWAYLALTATVEVEVPEALSWDGEHEFHVTLYPGESQTFKLLVANASSANLTVTLKVTVEPKLKGLTVTVPDSLVAIGGATTRVDAILDVAPDAEPGVCAVTIDFDR